MFGIDRDKRFGMRGLSNLHDTVQLSKLGYDCLILI
jgi:hypothetical protein